METKSRRSVIVAPLPDDVVVDILRRMSVLDVFNCRRVCRRWRDLVSTQHFQEMHHKANANRSPMVLFQMFKSVEEKGALLVLDKWEKPRKKPTIRRSRPNFIDNSGSIDVHLSCDGLIVIKSTGPVNGLSVFTILNPISGDAVRIETPTGFRVDAMFFNPSIKEYCLLFRNYQPSMRFEILNLGAQPCCRTLKQHVAVTYLIRIGYCGRPVVVDDDATIYWLVGKGCNPTCEEVILAFDFETESFSYMAHPHPMHNWYCQGLHREGDYVHIMKIDGSLSFVTIAYERTLRIINIWTLKDSAARLWTKTYNVSVSTDIRLVIPPWLTCFSRFKVMAVGNGEMLLHYGCGGIYVYDLELGTLRRIEEPYLNSLSAFVPNFFLFMPSCVSLRNCNPIIRISSHDDY